MKKLFILCITIASLTQLQAQAPQGFNYQATVRNSSGDLIVNTNVYFKFNVIQGSQTAVPIFTETHYVPTDDLGQVNLVIGQGTANTGIFSELDWSLGSYYLGIELDTGNGYVAMGTTQLLSVPYALYAENSGNSTPTTPNLEAVLAENNSANNQQIKDLQDPTEAQDAVTKSYVDSENTVQSISNILANGNDANGQQIKQLSDPTDAQDAATKSYVDALSNTQALMNFNGWDNYQISNDNSTFQLEPNSFLFLNADETTLILPQDGNYGDVVYIYVAKPATNGRKLYLQPNGTPYAYLDYDFNLITNDTETVYGTFGHGTLQILFKTSNYWMCSNFQELNPNDTDNDGDGYTENQGDCDDENPNINPNAEEIEDGVDNDCDGEVDEGFNESGTVTDINGNTYDYLTYGDQVWTVENAEMVTYRDGTPIPEVTDPTQWSNLTTGAWAYFNNDPTKPRLYNWYAVMGIHDTDPNTPNKEFAPEGWHVPSDAEWTTLENYLIANGYNYDGFTTENKIAKAMASTTGWISSTEPGVPGNDQSLNNSSGFNAFPEGTRSRNGSFYSEGSYAFFWSSTEYNTSYAWYRHLYSNSSNLNRFGSSFKQDGFSVRFVRD